MSPVLLEVIKALGFGCGYIFLFIIAEVIHKKKSVPVEWTRKGVHFLSASISIVFPLVFKYTLTLFILAVSFLIILIVGEKKGLLSSIGGVERKTKGEFYFPISIFIVYVLSHNNFVLYAVSMAVLAISDPLAALIGKSYGHVKYRVQTDLKSLEGSVTFFFATFLIVHIPILLFTNVSRANSLLISLVVAILVTCLESISLEGSDNLIIPLGTFFILYKLITKPTEMVFLQVMILIFIILTTIILTYRVHKIGSSGLITIILTSYAAWALCGLNYYIPTLLFFFGFLFMNIVFRVKPGDDPALFRTKAVLKLVYIPMAIVFAANFFSLEDFLSTVFLVSVSTHLTLLWRHWYLDRNVVSRFFRRWRKIFIHCGSVVSFLFVVLPWLFIFRREQILVLSAVLFIFNLLADAFYTILRSTVYREIDYRKNRALRNFVNLFITMLFLIQKFLGRIG